MLFVAGAVNRLGRVDDGTTVTDFDDEEIARKHTLSSSLAHAEWQKTKINIIDTPGFANFLDRRARRAARRRGAPWSSSTPSHGVEVQTEKLWAEAAALNLPRIVVVNRLDRERASLERTLEIAAPRLRPRNRADPAAASARRRRSPASSTWCA